MVSTCYTTMSNLSLLLRFSERFTIGNVFPSLASPFIGWKIIYVFFRDIKEADNYSHITNPLSLIV